MNETEAINNGTEGKQRLKSASRSSLPPCSAVFEDSDMMRETAALLKEAVKLKAKISEYAERLEEIDRELTATSMVLGTPEHPCRGFRHGLAGFEDRGWQARNTLNKQKLVSAIAEYGAPASVIDACYEKGKEFHDTRIVIFDLE